MQHFFIGMVWLAGNLAAYCLVLYWAIQIILACRRRYYGEGGDRD